MLVLTNVIFPAYSHVPAPIITLTSLVKVKQMLYNNTVVSFNEMTKYVELDLVLLLLWSSHKKCMGLYYSQDSFYCATLILFLGKKQILFRSLHVLGSLEMGCSPLVCVVIPPFICCFSEPQYSIKQ